MTASAPIRVGILTVSDRASRGVYQDLGGPAIRDCLTEILSSPWEPVARVIPDERPLIEQTLVELCDREGVPAYLETAKVFDLLLAVPKYGRVKVNKILTQCKIWPSKTVGGLSERQRRELVAFMRRR